jgi:hypothetical protein
MLLGENTAWIDAVILITTFVPIAALIVFAVWFLRQKDE